MKYIIIFFTILISQCASKNESNQEKKMDQNTVDMITNGNYSYKLIKLIADSRCPEGVQCIWEGQIEMIVGVYKDNTLVEEKMLVVNSKEHENNANWLNSFNAPKKVSFIGVLPKRVKDVPIPMEEYKLLIRFE